MVRALACRAARSRVNSGHETERPDLSASACMACINPTNTAHSMIVVDERVRAMTTARTEPAEVSAVRFAWLRHPRENAIDARVTLGYCMCQVRVK